ncbi:hypothetical protein [Dialister histaminiformans]|uniref:hypothetical protein n=1 Tax=Allisonella histaminiformans TaxID=209880 RepID=UPI0011780C9B|nr:hypothetical protein [Allisonella histaminiformans]
MPNKKDTVSGVSFVMHRIWSFICRPQYPLGNPPDFLFYGLKTYSFQRMNPLEAVPSQDFPASTFGPIWEIGDDFSLPAASLLVNPMPGVTFYSPSPNLPAFSAYRLNSLRFSQMGVFYISLIFHGRQP